MLPQLAIAITNSPLEVHAILLDSQQQTVLHIPSNPTGMTLRIALSAVLHSRVAPLLPGAPIRISPHPFCRDTEALVLVLLMLEPRQHH